MCPGIVSQMKRYSLEEAAVGPFNFRAVALAHGWVALAPYQWDGEAHTLGYTLRTPGAVVQLEMRKWASGVHATVLSPVPLAAADLAVVSQAVRRMWRLDEDLSPFHAARADFPDWQLDMPEGAGRLMRAPRLFDDVVYTICTTNITWGGTKRIARLLVEKLGEPFAGEGQFVAFPEPAAIASAGPDFLRQETGLGYRSEYVWQLADDAVTGKFDEAWFEDPERPTDELLKGLLGLTGVGPYAAATLLALLGRYERISIDSVARFHVSRKYLKGEAPTDAQINQIYAPWGKWRQLAYWFDMAPTDDDSQEE